MRSWLYRFLFNFAHRDAKRQLEEFGGGYFKGLNDG